MNAAFRVDPRLIEHRVYPRHPILQRCFVWPEGALVAEAWRCVAFNISTAGIGLTLPCPLQPETVLCIEPWELPGSRRLRARVVQARPVDFVYFAGCELDSP